MDVKDAIKARRSIRKFTGEVSDDLVKELAEAARLAPSGSNVQPTRLFFIRDGGIKRKLEAEEAFEQDFVHKAPLIIVFSGNPNDYETSYPGLAGKGRERTLRDVTIASSFVVLRATELGLSSCWVGLIDPGVIKRVLEIPSEHIIPFVLCIGKAGERPGLLKRKTTGEIISGDV
ncbi:MAG: nitroreductase family protein [Candidatus Altiarchaeota archaeon]|nr:nitroreductase family protein [Candidatus Altiarchaeota archaeon]